MKSGALTGRYVVIGVRCVPGLAELLGQVVRGDGCPVVLGVDLFRLKRAIRLALASLQRRDDIVTWLKSAADMEKNTLTVSPGKTQGYENPEQRTHEASLGQAEILSVQDPRCDCSFGAIHTTSVLPFFPWRLQLAVFPSKRAKKASESVPFVAEDAGDVFPDDDAGGLSLAGANTVNCICKLHVFYGEGAAGIGGEGRPGSLLATAWVGYVSDVARCPLLTAGLAVRIRCGLRASYSQRQNSICSGRAPLPRKWPASNAPPVFQPWARKIDSCVSPQLMHTLPMLSS